MHILLVILNKTCHIFFIFQFIFKLDNNVSQGDMSSFNVSNYNFNSIIDNKNTSLIRKFTNSCENYITAGSLRVTVVDTCVNWSKLCLNIPIFISGPEGYNKQVPCPPRIQGALCTWLGLSWPSHRAKGSLWQGERPQSLTDQTKRYIELKAVSDKAKGLNPLQIRQKGI